MTDQFTVLTPESIRAIMAHLDDSIDILARHSGRLSPGETQIKGMLAALREQLTRELERHDSAES